MDKNRSMVDVAYELMSKKKKAVNFYKLWQKNLYSIQTLL